MLFFFPFEGQEESATDKGGWVQILSQLLFSMMTLLTQWPREGDHTGATLLLLQTEANAPNLERDQGQIFFVPLAFFLIKGELLLNL